MTIFSFKQRRQKHKVENEKDCKTKSLREGNFSEPAFQSSVWVGGGEREARVVAALA
jgi:hypothetical protein